MPDGRLSGGSRDPGWQPDLNYRSFSRSPGDREIAAERPDAFPHREQPESGRMLRLRGIETDAVVGDAKNPASVVAPERDGDVLRARVFADIGERLLRDPVQRDAGRRGQHEIVVMELDAAGHPKPLLEFQALPLERGPDAEVIEHRWTEVLDDPALDLDRVVDRRHRAQEPRALQILR